MQEEQNNEEKVTNFKETFEDFVKEEKPILSQEEEIQQYKDNMSNLYKKKKKDNEEDENEDDEHLKRVKRELIESLHRVDEMAKNIFKEKDIDKEKLKNIKLNKKSSGGKRENEQVLEQMKKMQENSERSREE